MVSGSTCNVMLPQAPRAPLSRGTFAKGGKQTQPYGDGLPPRTELGANRFLMFGDANVQKPQLVSEGRKHGGVDPIAFFEETDLDAQIVSGRAEINQSPIGDYRARRFKILHVRSHPGEHMGSRTIKA